MTALGGWGGLPLRMGGGRSSAEATYVALRDGMGTAYSRDDSARANREKRCMALAIARAEAAQERGAVQALPDLASDRLTDWERALQAPVDPSDPMHLRAETCMGILAGNGVAERDSIASAVSTVLGGELVYVIAAKATAHPTLGYDTYFWPTVTVFDGIGGSLQAGTHYLYGAHQGADGIVYFDSMPVTFSCPSIDSSILVGPIGVVGQTNYFYLSTSPGSTSAALVATQYGVGPITIDHYPSSKARAGLHHLAIAVSAATAADSIRRMKIHAVLGTMLPSWVTYSIITGSPFVLGAGGSALGLGGL